MRVAVKLHFLLLVLAVAFAGFAGTSEAQRAGQYKKLLVKFPAFSLGAGEKVVGVNMTVYNGEIVHVLVPRGWNCRRSGMPVTEHILHCYSPNTSYAITMTGKLPQISIFDMSEVTKKTLSLEAAVELEDSSGSGFSKQFAESELDIQ